MSPSFWIGFFFTIALLLVIVIWSIRRHRNPILHIECDSPIDELMPSLAGLTLGTAMAGNTVEVLENGAFFDVLIDRIRRRRESVHFETFLWKEGTLGRRVADALIERARAGVKVRVLLDAEGSKKAGKAVVRADARRGLPAWCSSTSGRSATSACSTTATTASWWSSTGARPSWAAIASWTSGWAMRRTESTTPTSACTCTGPSCTACRRAFSENWAGETGELFVGDDVFPDAGAGGRHPDPRRVRQARELGAGGEDPAPHRHLPGAQAHLDPEPLFHPRARCHRRLRRRR